jgi:hypothetical protein
MLERKIILRGWAKRFIKEPTNTFDFLRLFIHVSAPRWCFIPPTLSDAAHLRLNDAFRWRKLNVGRATDGAMIRKIYGRFMPDAAPNAGGLAVKAFASTVSLRLKKC